MRAYIKIFIVSAIVCAILFLASGASLSSVFASEPDYNYLVVGFDDAAENTDVICIANYDTASGGVNVFQLPRDTYYDSGTEVKKINGVFTLGRLHGNDTHDSMSALTRVVSKELGIKIHSYLGLSTKSFITLIDAMGGVTLDFPIDISNSDGKIIYPQGSYTLCGEDALKLVRHREGYIRGDLDRLDIQKIFIRGVLKSVTRGGSMCKLLLAILKTRGIVTDFTLRDFLPLLRGGATGLKNATLSCVTLPGEAAFSKSGVSYYVLNRAACVELFKKHFDIDSKGFDPYSRFFSESEAQFSEIYNSNTITYHEYVGDEPIEIKQLN